MRASSASLLSPSSRVGAEREGHVAACVRASSTPSSTPSSPPSAWVQTLQRAWLGRGPLACLLWPLSLLYRAAWALRAALYRSGLKGTTRLPVPVLVVGNVVVGGSGKTPTLIGLVQHLLAQGWRPGVLSRGHGRRSTACLPVLPNSRAEQVGDEPLLIAQRTGVPVYVGRERAAAGQALLAAHPEVNLLLCDDGMQHWALARDLTVLVFDARGRGNGWLLPAGMLRQPWPAPVWGGGPLIVLQTGLPAGSHPDPALAAGAPAFAATRRLAEQAYDADGQRVALQRWAPPTPVPAPASGDPGAAGASVPAPAPAPMPGLGAARCAALAGIAQPEAFFTLLRQRGLVLQHTLALPDHADASTLLQALAPYPSDWDWLCTEKDAVKLFAALRLGSTPPHRVWAVALEQEPASGFYSAVAQALGRTEV